MRMPALLFALLFYTSAPSHIALAADAAPAVLTVQNKHFDPQQLTLPGGVKIKLVIRNLDDLPAEFESYDLSREILIPAHGETTLYIGPLDPGNYPFFNDFNRDMRGTIVARPTAN